MKKFLLSLDHKVVTVIWAVSLVLVGGIALLERFIYPESFPFVSLFGFFLILLTTNYLIYLAGNFQYRKTLQAIQASFTNMEDLQSVQQVLQPRYLMPNTRVWAGSPDLIKILVDQVLTRRPTTIIEIGGGVSSLYLAYALEKAGQGKLLAIDHLAEFAEQTGQALRQHGLEKFVEIVHAPLQTLKLDGQSWQWYQPDFLEDLPEIDLLIVDGPPWTLQPLARYPALPLLYKKLAKNAVVVIDDYIRKDEQEMVRQWMKRYPEFNLKTFPTEKGTALLLR